MIESCATTLITEGTMGCTEERKRLRGLQGESRSCSVLLDS